jgi:hypothetical protein
VAPLMSKVASTPDSGAISVGVSIGARSGRALHAACRRGVRGLAGGGGDGGGGAAATNASIDRTSGSASVAISGMMTMAAITTVWARIHSGAVYTSVRRP